jgi:hypothetical protein
LKSGFEAAAGDLLAFMDGDATCDPRLFARLSRPILAGEADLVNGNRLHAQSRMPRVRYFGNWVIARTMRLLSGSAVADGCSGMRVFRRSMLPLVKGLPDDLSFSPALTATTLFTAGLQMAEAPIDYRERIGRSKLSLGRDTYRFFREAFKAYRRRRPGKLNASQRGGPSGTAGGGQS